MLLKVWRLRHHPSILVWAGNNEIEADIAGIWYSPVGYSHEDVVTITSIQINFDLIFGCFYTYFFKNHGKSFFLSNSCHLDL